MYDISIYHTAVHGKNISFRLLNQFFLEPSLKSEIRPEIALEIFGNENHKLEEYRYSFVTLTR